MNNIKKQKYEEQSLNLANIQKTSKLTLAMKFIVIVLFFSTLLTSCHKEPINEIHSPDSTTVTYKPAKSIAIFSQSVTSAENIDGYLSLYDPNLNLKWQVKFDSLPYNLKRYIMYGEEKVYALIGDTLYAYDYSNGTLIWKSRYWKYNAFNTTYDKGAIYVSSSQQVYQIKAADGTLKKIIAIPGLSIDKPLVKDSLILVRAGYNQLFWPILMAYNINDGQRLWVNDKVGSTNTDNDQTIIGNKVFSIASGLSSNCTNVNIQNGSIAWDLDVAEAKQFIASGNSIYLCGGLPNQLYKVDINTGNVYWKWKMDEGHGPIEALYAYQKNIHFMYLPADVNVDEPNPYNLVTIDNSTGNIISEKENAFPKDVRTRQIDVGGDKVFALEFYGPFAEDPYLFVRKAEDYSSVNSIRLYGSGVSDFHLIRDGD